MWRSAVQLRAGLRYGGIAQLVEHLLCKQRVKSSNLFISTKKKHLQKCRCFFCFMPIRSHLLLLASGRGLPPIHFGRADGVERTLLRMACQSETFLAPPWQGDANIRALWHIGCQSEIDELVSMASRPVYRGFCRMAETKVPFLPVKGGFGRMGMLPMTFRPVKGGFARTKLLIAEVQSQASRPIELGAAIEL